MALNLSSPIVRASFGLVVGFVIAMVLRMIPGLGFINLWYAIGAGALGAAAMVVMGRGAGRTVG